VFKPALIPALFTAGLVTLTSSTKPALVAELTVDKAAIGPAVPEGSVVVAVIVADIEFEVHNDVDPTTGQESRPPEEKRRCEN
jgi:hypothetical protein